MLLNLFRAVFILVIAGLAVRLGQTASAETSYWGPVLLFSGVMAIAAVVLAIDLLIPRKRIQTISAVYFGLIVGLFLSYLLQIAMEPTFNLLFGSAGDEVYKVVAGLMTAMALLLRQVAHGLGGGAVPRRFGYTRTAAAGLLIAGATGVAAWGLGKPFLTTAHAEPVLPLIGALSITSATLFDLGIYLAVLGTTMLALVSLADTPEASHER